MAVKQSVTVENTPSNRTAKADARRTSQSSPASSLVL
jgi:hypothetical protein